MDPWFDPRHQIETGLREAATRIGLESEAFQPQVRPADPRFGDYQANGVLPYAKLHRANPRELATRLEAELKSCGVLDPKSVESSVAGPGFINFALKPAFLLAWLHRYRDEEDLRTAAGQIYQGKRIVIDFSSPNMAKQMHVGHIRSTVIGEALRRLLKFCGAAVTSDNHIGDWGTPYGTIIMAARREGLDLDHLEGDPLEAIEALYRRGTRYLKEDPSAQVEARRELVKLQQGDPANTTAWNRINAISLASAQSIYDRLGVSFDQTLGESFYRDKVDRVYRELTECRIAEESEGALVVFHPDHPRFAEQAFMVRKSDGASNYATTDLATVLYRVEHFGSQEIIYVTDARQRDHFEQLFLTARKWFECQGYPLPTLTHIWFGTILGEDGKAIKTRSGEPIRLSALLDEAEERAYALVSEKNPDLPENERRNIARVVGTGAVRYADLSQNRTSDYVFAWDKLLSLEGNTAPYLLYAVARLHSIFRRAELRPGDLSQEAGATAFETDAERALARKLVGFVAALEQTLSDLRPHVLCSYLYELAGEFSTFYNADRVIVDDPPVKARRLILCARTLRVMETGLHLLGLETLERM